MAKQNSKWQAHVTVTDLKYQSQCSCTFIDRTLQKMVKAHSHTNSVQVFITTTQHGLVFVTPWSRVLQKLIVPHLIKKRSALYGTQRFITMFTKAYHLSLAWARSIQSKPNNPTSLRSILILYYSWAVLQHVILLHWKPGLDDGEHSKNCMHIKPHTIFW
jgi:hypothetical protein